MSFISGLSAFIDSQGGLDGITLPYVGKKIIFAQQQDYTDFDGEYDGWVRYGSLWDDVTGWDDGIIGYDEYEVIAGYESSLDGSTVNQRASIWLITEGDNGELRLEFDSEITLGDTVEVLNGSKFGGKVLRYGPLIYYGLNETVLS